MRDSFGLNNWTDTEEKIFLLQYYGGFLYSEVRNLPIYKVKWWIERINEEFKKSNEAGDAHSKAAHNNTPGDRELKGADRAHVPSRLTRFT